mmetsp:Transcript_18757/g.17885  ORF Transcript_18757/g.17885 Transcript_18757/m.17885 type:complete len:304 (-) Transcript_18757:913-1824(-)
MSVVEGASEVLVGFFFLLEVLFELAEPFLEFPIDLQVPLHDPLHPAHVLIDVILHGPYPLHIGDQFPLFGEERSGLFDVLEVLVEEFLLFFHNLVHLLMERKQLRVHELLSMVHADGLLEEVPVFLLLLLQHRRLVLFVLISGVLIPHLVCGSVGRVPLGSLFLFLRLLLSIGERELVLNVLVEGHGLGRRSKLSLGIILLDRSPSSLTDPSLQPHCVAECVQGVVRRRGARVYASNHHNLRSFLVEEGVSEDHGEFGGSEGDVGAFHVEGPDALLEGQEALIDLSPFDPPLPIVALGVLSSF